MVVDVVDFGQTPEFFPFNLLMLSTTEPGPGQQNAILQKPYDSNHQYVVLPFERETQQPWLISPRTAADAH